MAVELKDAREWLRIDGTDNDDIITGLLNAAPSYIEASTGFDRPKQQDAKIATLCDTVTKMLLSLWYKPEQAEAERLQKTIDSLLKLITVLGNG